MALTNAGRNHFATGVLGGSVTDYNNANSYIGVGTSGTTFAATQTDLMSFTQLRKAMDATYPVCVSGNILVFRSTFSTSEANFAWEEWGVFNHSTSGNGTMLNRKAESLGTKTSAQSWTITANLTVQNP